MSIEQIFDKYFIGVLVCAICLIGYLILVIYQHRRERRRRNILIHLMQAIFLCSFFSIFGLYLNIAIAEFEFSAIYQKMVNFFVLLSIAMVFVWKVHLLIQRLGDDQIKKGRNPTSTKIITRLFNLLLVMITILLFGAHFDMSLTGLMTFGGVGGIAIGLASRDVLSNLFSGVMLYFDRPFNIGDWISSPDRQIEGIVQEIGWRITKIETFDNRPLYVPNSVFSSISVENPGRMSNRRIQTTIGLRYEDGDKVGVVVTDIRRLLQMHESIDTTQTLLVYFNAFGDSTLNIMVYCFTKTTVWEEWLAIQQAIYLEIIAIVHRHGADFAFPSQTLYLEKSDPPQK